MGDIAKIAVKTALVAGVIASAVVLITSIQLPQVDFTVFREVVGHGKAIVNYYAGGTVLTSLFTIGLALLSFKYVVIPTLALASMAIRWIFKVNE